MSAATFPACLAFTLRYEGGLADDPRDPGGRTNQGITQKTFEGWLTRRGQPARNVFTLTAAERDAIYRGGFWDAVKADGLPAGVDLAVFDYAVNSGPARALQALAAASRGAEDPAAVIRGLCAARLSFLHALRTFSTFGRGWTARVAACEALALKMAEHARTGIAPEAPTTPGTAAKLAVESRAAGDRASRQGRRAAAVLGVGGAGLATQAVLQPMPPLGLALLLAVTAALSVALLWHGWRARSRAAALAAVAAEGRAGRDAVAASRVAAPLPARS